MEKIICALWADGDREGFNQRLIADLAPRLKALGARHIRINVQDATVAPGAPLIQKWTDPQFDAAMQFWLPSSNPIFREAVDEAIAAHCARFAAWLVVESTIIPNGKYPPTPGQRTDGFSQMAFLVKPDRLSWEAWRTIWHTSHTQIAIDTQANFEYIQNLVVRPLTEDAPPFVGIVEECFPLTALTDPMVFFDAVGDQEKFDRNLATMMESCDRFIDRGVIDVILTSQYDFA
jgi:hypothetical protein